MLDELHTNRILLGHHVNLTKEQVERIEVDSNLEDKKPTQELLRLYNTQSGKSKPFFLGVANWLPGHIVQPKRLVNMAEFESETQVQV